MTSSVVPGHTALWSAQRIIHRPLGSAVRIRYISSTFLSFPTSLLLLSKSPASPKWHRSSCGKRKVQVRNRGGVLESECEGQPSDPLLLPWMWSPVTSWCSGHRKLLEIWCSSLWQIIKQTGLSLSCWQKASNERSKPAPESIYYLNILGISLQMKCSRNIMIK